jgi:hypothetical protein
MQAFGALPFGVGGSQAVVAEAPDADGLLQLAAAARLSLVGVPPGERRHLGRMCRGRDFDLDGSAAPSVPV